MPVERRPRVGPGRDADTGAVGHADALAVAIGDRARPFDDDRIEHVGVVEHEVDGRERRHDRYVALLQKAHRPLVEERRVLDGIDAGLGRDAHAAGPVRVGRDAQPGVVRLVDRRARLLRRVLRRLGRRAFAEDPARREDLDHLGARGDLLAHRLSDLIWAVGDAADLGPVPAGRGHAASRGDDAWSFHDPALDRARDVDDHRAVRSEVPNGGDAGAQRRAGVAERFQRGERVPLAHLGAEIHLAVERQVRVAVDQPGKQRLAASVICVGAAEPRKDLVGRADGRDPRVDRGGRRRGRLGRVPAGAGRAVRPDGAARPCAHPSPRRRGG